MTRLDVLGDRLCVGLCWLGVAFILYSHVMG